MFVVPPPPGPPSTSAPGAAPPYDMTQAGATGAPPAGGPGGPPPGPPGAPGAAAPGVNKKGVMAAIVCLTAGAALGWFVANRFGKGSAGRTKEK